MSKELEDVRCMKMEGGSGAEGAAVINCSEETPVLLQPAVQRAPHPADMHAPSKINFPFRPCCMFSSGLLLRESFL